jgi:hypothetical protein
MSAPTSGSSTTDTQIEVTWSAVSSAPANGGSAITSYHLQWDAGTSGVTWTDVIGLSPSYTGTSYIVSTSVTAGSSY